jgi:hypothetical protein
VDQLKKLNKIIAQILDVKRYNISYSGGGNGAVVASFLGKALMLSPDSEVMGLKPTPLIKLIYHRNHLRTHEPPNKHKSNALSDHRKIRILRIKSAATTRGP